MALVRFKCCFCGGHIKADPSYIEITADFLNKETNDNAQGFFCHYACFKNSMNPGTVSELGLENDNKPN